MKQNFIYYYENNKFKYIKPLQLQIIQNYNTEIKHFLELNKYLSSITKLSFVNIETFKKRIQNIIFDIIENYPNTKDKFYYSFIIMLSFIIPEYDNESDFLVNLKVIISNFVNIISFFKLNNNSIYISKLGKIIDKLMQINYALINNKPDSDKELIKFLLEYNINYCFIPKQSKLNLYLSFESSLNNSIFAQEYTNLQNRS